MSTAGESRLRALIVRSAASGASARASAGAVEEQERCGMCGAPVPPEHRHVADLRNRELQCACRACALLFDHSSAGGGHFRLIPDRCERIDRLALDELQWRALGIPVEMAFFVRDGRTARIGAFYPSPAGAIESQLPLDAWEEIEYANPRLAALEPDVEALLVDRTAPDPRGYIVGIDECYRLVAVVRRHWRGFTGGEEVWPAIERFFGGLEARAGQPA